MQAIEAQLASTKLEELEPGPPEAARRPLRRPQRRLPRCPPRRRARSRAARSRRTSTPRSGVRVASFNSCRLKSDQLAMHDQVSALAAVLANFDVIVVQEVPPKEDAAERVSQLCDVLASQYAAHGRKYRFAISNASGPPSSAEFGKEGKYRERHAILVREPFRILSHLELSKLGVVVMDYAPLTVIVEVDEEAEAILGTKRLVSLDPHAARSARRRATRSGQPCCRTTR